MEIFLSEHVQSLLHNKFVVIIGDSVQRAVYKDLVTLIQSNNYTSERELKTKGERSFQGDVLIEGGELAEMNNRKSYREVRQWQHPYHLVRFYFVTRCYSEYMETILLDLEEGPSPDVIVMNSCLWDITRYGPTSMKQYQKNMQTLFGRFNMIIPKETLVIWHTTMPIAEKIRGGFLIKQIEFMNDVLRLDVMVANFYAAQVVQDHGYDVLDLHHTFRSMLSHRKSDGVHWDNKVHRRITNVLLSHICKAWSIQLPRQTAYHRQPAKEPYWHNMQEDISDCNNNSSNYQNAYQSEEERYGGPIRRMDYHHRSVSAPHLEVSNFRNQNQQQQQVHMMAMKSKAQIDTMLQYLSQNFGDCDFRYQGQWGPDRNHRTANYRHQPY